MNKTIKFFDFEKGEDIKILASHGLITSFNNNIENPQVSLYPEDVNSDYAIANEDTFEIVMTNLYNKLIKQYMNNEEENKPFFIRLGTVLNDLQVAKENLDVNILPFKSTKNIFLDPRQFNIDIVPVPIEGKDAISKVVSLHINTISFSKLSNKDILESIVLIQCLNGYDCKIDLKIRRHIWNKKLSCYSKAIDTDRYHFVINYHIESGITHIFKEIFDALKNAIINSNRFIDFSKREKKEVIDNILEHTKFSDKKIKFVKSRLKYDKEFDGYLYTTEESIRDINKADEIFKDEYYNNIQSLTDRDRFHAVFTISGKKDFSFSDIPTSDQIIILPDLYGIMAQPLLENDNLSDDIPGYLVEKTATVIKFSTFYIPLPTMYNVSLSVNIKKKMIKLEISSKFTNVFKDIVEDVENISLTGFTFKTFIDPSVYFPNQNEKINEINKLRFNRPVHKEIKKEIDNFPENTAYSLNPKNNMYQLANILFNPNIFNTLLNDVCFVSDNWKV